jgi:hypothetical protein
MIDVGALIRPGARLRHGAALVIVLVLAVGVVLVLRTPTRACKGVGIATSIGAPGAPVAGHPTPEAAVDAFVQSTPVSLRPGPVPTDGWYEDGSVWVRDLPDGARYELTVMEQASGGWLAAGSWSICSST